MPISTSSQQTRPEYAIVKPQDILVRGFPVILVLETSAPDWVVIRRSRSLSEIYGLEHAESLPCLAIAQVEMAPTQVCNPMQYYAHPKLSIRGYSLLSHMPENHFFQGRWLSLTSLLTTPRCINGRSIPCFLGLSVTFGKTYWLIGLHSSAVPWLCNC